jgi:hypothetical protein
MSKKIITAIIIAFLVIPLYFQTVKVSAQVVPLTGPVTPPVTTPVTFFNLTGKVVYKQLGRLFGNAQRIIPAPNVLIRVFSFFGHTQVASTTTDGNGNYGLSLPNGLYRVEASGGTNAFFVPPLRVVNLKNNQHKTADFQALRFSF